MRSRRQPAHHLNHHRTADPIVPCFAQIAVRSIEDHERRIWNDRISRLDSHFAHILGIPRPNIEQNHVAGKDPHALLLRHYMNVAYAGNGMYGPLRSQNDPTLVDQRLIQPTAQHLHGEKAVRGHAPDHAAQLIHMGIHHDSRPLRSLRGDNGAHAIKTQARRIGLHDVNHDLTDRFFKTRRPRSKAEPASNASKKRIVGFISDSRITDS